MSTKGQPPKKHSTPTESKRPRPPVGGFQEANRGKGSPDEIKLCGFNACMKLYETRAEDIIRVYLVESRAERCVELIKSCARRRKAYHIVSAADLDKIAGSSHHEGICILAKRKPPLGWDGFLRMLEQDPDDPLLALILEDVENPHNVGAIVRSAANFGCRFIILPGEKTYKPSAALMRTAEGGGESVEIMCAPSFNVIAAELRHRDVRVLGTAMQGRIKLYDKGDAGLIPKRTAIVFGNEAKGLSADARKNSQGLISIPGSGAVDSLNVGVAAALILGEYHRQHGFPRNGATR